VDMIVVVVMTVVVLVVMIVIVVVMVVLGHGRDSVPYTGKRSSTHRESSFSRR
jgi:hypothetical protein